MYVFKASKDFCCFQHLLVSKTTVVFKSVLLLEVYLPFTPAIFSIVLLNIKILTVGQQLNYF